MKKCVCIALIMLSGISISAQEPTLPDPENFHLFLLAGQSNMAGRGKVTPEDRVIHPRVLMLNRKGEWVPAKDPVHFDKRSAGVGPGRSFGIALAEANPEITIGLIPSATGGSPISVWAPGKLWEQTKSYPYDDAIQRTQHAMKDGTLKAILWHQGEGDSTPDLAHEYFSELDTMINRFRNDLRSPYLPIFIGQLGQFTQRPWSSARHEIDRAHQAAAENDPNSTFVSSTGLTCQSDELHFDAESAREFGKRYAKAYQQWKKQIPPTQK